MDSDCAEAGALGLNFKLRGAGAAAAADSDCTGASGWLAGLILADSELARRTRTVYRRGGRLVPGRLRDSDCATVPGRAVG